jgi:hypothetical protein
MQEPHTVPSLAWSFAGLFIKAAALSAPESSGPSLGDFKEYLLTAIEMEAAIFGGRLACSVKNSRPYALLAVVHHYELNPICKQNPRSDNVSFQLLYVTQMKQRKLWERRTMYLWRRGGREYRGRWEVRKLPFFFLQDSWM